MTVQDLNGRATSAVRAREGLSGVAAGISAALEILRQAELPKADYDRISALLFQASVPVNAAKEQLLTYQAMLEDVARTTEIPWPPGTGRKD